MKVRFSEGEYYSINGMQVAKRVYFSVIKDLNLFDKYPKFNDLFGELDLGDFTVNTTATVTAKSPISKKGLKQLISYHTKVLHTERLETEEFVDYLLFLEGVSQALVSAVDGRLLLDGEKFPSIIKFDKGSCLDDVCSFSYINGILTVRLKKKIFNHQ